MVAQGTPRGRLCRDNEVIDFETILHVFFATNDPTTLNRQGGRNGTQYRSAFHHDAMQKETAEKVIKELDSEGLDGDPIVTEVTRSTSSTRRTTTRSTTSVTATAPVLPNRHRPEGAEAAELVRRADESAGGGLMPNALLLTYSDFLPLREDPKAIHGALKAVEDAVKAQQSGIIRQHNIVDRYEGEFEVIRVAVTAREGLMSGMRLFGYPLHIRRYMLFDGVTRAPIAFMDYGVLNSMRVGQSPACGQILAPGREDDGVDRSLAGPPQVPCTPACRL